MTIAVGIVGATGRMGQMIRAKVEQDAGCRLAALVDTEERLASLQAPAGVLVSNSLDDALPALHKEAGRTGQGVIIDFTAPDYSVQVAERAAAHGVAHVVGATGLTAAHKAALEEEARKAPLFWSPNMSIGVGVLVRILPELARLLGPSYDMEIVEIHHRHKKDAPSGTAIRLGEALAGARDWDADDVFRTAREGLVGERPDDEIGIQALRGGDVAGIHTVYFLGSGERIEVTHQAHSRDNFAEGAVRAAKWLVTQKPGRLYGMKDLI